MTAYVLAFLIGVVAGLRSMTAPAVVSWAARLGWLHLEDTGLAFLGYAFTPWVLSVLAIGELIADKLPKTPSRKAPAGVRRKTGDRVAVRRRDWRGKPRNDRRPGGGVDRRGGGDAGRLRGADPAGQSHGREGSSDRAAGGRGGNLRGGLDRRRIRMTHNFDAIVIGTGQAGPSLAQRLAAAGMKVAIVERKLFGGTCVNTGCIPTKTMVASAYAAHMARRAARIRRERGRRGERRHAARQGEEGRRSRGSRGRESRRG